MVHAGSRERIEAQQSSDERNVVQMNAPRSLPQRPNRRRNRD